MSNVLLFYVQHLLGIGHVRRIGLIATAAAARGFECHLVIGGRANFPMPLPAVRCHYLPSIGADQSQLSRLVNASGEPVSEQDFQQRQAALITLFDQLRPAALILEMYPFGRRQFAAELDPLLAHAKARGARCISSIRDILVNPPAHKRQSKHRWIIERANRYLDALLIHADPELITLDQTFPTASLTAALHYTGFVAPRAPSEPHPAVATRRSGWVVTAGGGAVGRPLLECSLALADTAWGQTQHWTLIAGPNLPEADYQRLQQRSQALPQLTVHRCVSCLPSQIVGAELVISQAGYNSVCDILATGTNSVLVPYHTDDQNEQYRRAQALAEKGLTTLLEPSTLGPETLKAAITTALHTPPSSNALRHSLQLDGAGKSAQLIEHLIRR